MAEDDGRVPMSPGLQATLLRAREYAAGQSEAQVLLEHLLLALSEDSDAAHVLEACQVDLSRLRNDVAGYLGSLDDRVAPGTPGAPAISQSLTQVLRYATLAAQQGRRSSIDGAIVLAALVGDGRSMAASLLKAQGLTFDAAIQALRHAATKGNSVPPASGYPSAAVATPAQNAPAPYSDAAFATTTRAEDILARARERVETRSQPRTDAPRRPIEGSPPDPAPPTFPPQPPQVVNPAPPQLDPAPEADPAEWVDDRTSSPADPFAPPSRPSDQPPPSQNAGPAADVAPPTPAPRAAESAAEAFTAPPRNAPSPAASIEAPGDEVDGLSEPPILETPRRIPQPVPSEPRSELPAEDATAPDQTQLPAPVRQGPPLRASQAEQPPTPAGWAPPPIRPSAPAQPAVRALAPPPHRSNAPPLPPGQPPRPPEPFRARSAQAEPPPAQWSRPPIQLDPHREPPAAGYSSPITGPPQTGTGYASSMGGRPAIDPGQITHSIPRRLKLGRPHVIEIWIERPPIAGNSGSRSFALRSENVVARAIAVRLRPLSGKFVIDPASPETQWDQSGAAGSDRLTSEAAVWRFTVTPLRSGRGILQLGISARTLGADGVLAETQLPDQAHELRIARSYVGLLRRILLVLGGAVTGIVLIKLVEAEIGVDFYYLFKQLLRFRG